MSNKGKTYIKGLLSLALLAWLFSTIDGKKLLSIVKNVDAVWLLGALVWILAAMVVSTIKWQLLLKAVGVKLPWGFTWRSYWVGIFFNNFLPSSLGGDAMRIYLVAKETGDTSGASASVVLERLLAASGLAAVGLIAAPFAQGRLYVITLLFALMAFVSLLLVAIIIRPGCSLFISRLLPLNSDKIKGFFEEFFSRGKRVSGQRAVIFHVFLWSIVFQICVVMVNYYIFRALHVEQVSMVNAAYLIPATSIAAMIPVGINGYGVRESAYVLLLASLNVTKASAVATSLIFAVLVSLCSVYGGWVWVKGAKLRPALKGLEADLVVNPHD